MNKFLIGGIVIAILALLGFALFGNQAGDQASSIPEQTTPQISEDESDIEEQAVTLTSSGFTPSTLRIKAGTKVVWENKSGSLATVDSEFHPTHRLYPLLNKGNFGPGETHSVTFGDAGTYTYHNHINSSQTGTIIVE